MRQVGVECVFAKNGTLRVRRIQVDKRWIPVDQGRQWVDREGRHALVRYATGQVREIRLRPDTMTWELHPVAGSNFTLV